MAIKPTERQRERPIPVSTVSIQEGLIAFAVASSGRIEFGTPMNSPLAVLGLRLCPIGHIDLVPHSFEIHAIEISSIEAVPEDAHWFDTSDWSDNYHKQTVNALKRLASKAFLELLLKEEQSLSDIYLDKLDDMALDLMASVEHWRTKLQTETEADWKDIRIWEDLLDESQRKLDGVDQSAFCHSSVFRSRPGYVVLRDERPLLRPTRWGHNPAGGLGKVFHTHHHSCRALLRDTGCEGSIVRARLIDGKIWRVGDKPMPFEWTIRDAIHTYDREGETQSPSPRRF